MTVTLRCEHGHFRPREPRRATARAVPVILRGPRRVRALQDDGEKLENDDETLTQLSSYGSNHAAFRFAWMSLRLIRHSAI